MEYRAVKNRCAITFNRDTIANLPPREDCVEILSSLGFVSVIADVVELACSYLGHSNWKRHITIESAPEVFNCSVFTKYLFGQAGIWIPRLAVQQREFGVPVPLEEVCRGDLIFVEGRHAFYYNDPNDGVGHVGIVGDNKTVIHAGGPDKCVNKMPIKEFLTTCGSFRGVRRIVPKGEMLYTFFMPRDKQVEYSDDLRWLIMANLRLLS